MQKVWVFQSKRAFTAEDINLITNKLSPFITQWKAHGNDLSASFSLAYNQFIIVTVDEEMEKASGCSIDSLTRVIKELDAQLQLSLLDRTLISYILEENSIKTISLLEFKKAIKDGILLPETEFFNLAVSNSKEYENQFKIKVKDSWAKGLISEATNI